MTKLYELMGKTPGKKWSPEDLFDFQSCFYRFQQAYSSQGRGCSRADARLRRAADLSGGLRLRRTASIKRPQRVRAGDLQADLVVSSSSPRRKQTRRAALPPDREAKQGLSAIRLAQSRRQKVRCAFLYNRSPQDSGWSYWHELGSKALEDTFGSRVETRLQRKRRAGGRAGIGHRAIHRAMDTTSFSPHRLFSSTPASVSVPSHPNAENPELLRSSPAITMSAAITCACTRPSLSLARSPPPCPRATTSATSRTTPSTARPRPINAFALGAQLINPARANRAGMVHHARAQSGGRPSLRAAYTSSPAATSARRIWNPARSALYHEQDGVISNLAMPVWGWGKLYEGIVRSILTGAWGDEGEHNADRAMAYYMGMSTDAIDLICSQRLPARTQRLVDLLHERIRRRRVPAVRRSDCRPKRRQVHVEANVALTPQEIILHGLPRRKCHRPDPLAGAS